MNLTEKIIREHLVDGKMRTGEEIALKIDQTLTQDATGTLVMLTLEAMKLDHVKTEVSAQYVDHNLTQADHKNADDHLFLENCCRRFGVWYSRAGNGVSHPVHMERFGKPGKTLLGSDSHTPAAGSMGMLAIGAGGIEVAMAMSGEPFHVAMPRVIGVRVENELPPWVSAKDVILELLRRHSVKWGTGAVLEFFGDGLRCLSAMDRHVIANMGTELGATSTVFPSDDAVRRFLRSQQREEDWRELAADADAKYDSVEEIDLSKVEPLIAMPSSPDNVERVADVAGEPIYQAYIGSSANPGYRDLAIAAEIVKGKQVPARVSLDINPSSRQILENLMADGHIASLIHAGARLHQAGCNGCIGMGQAPATGKLSLRTVPRNFPGRSGTDGDRVCLVSPETAAASALRGEITDPRDLEGPYPEVREPEKPSLNFALLTAPPSPEDAPREIESRGPNIDSIPQLEATPETLEVVVLLKVQDNISTDEILPAGSRVLPYRSNIPKISEFAFAPVDDTYSSRARQALNEERGHAIIAGENYGQGSSREHAALAPRYLGLRLVIAQSFARIHWQNLISYGVLPVTFEEPADHDAIESNTLLRIENLRDALRAGDTLEVIDTSRDATFRVRHRLSTRQVDILLAGGLINVMRKKLARGS